MTPDYIWRCFRVWLPELAQKANSFSTTKMKNTIRIYVNNSPLIFTVFGPNQWSLKTEKGQ